MKKIKSAKFVQPIYIFISTRKNFKIHCIFNFVISITLCLFFCFFDIQKQYNVETIFKEFIDLLVTGISILLSFSIAVLTIFVTSESKNVEALKNNNASSKYKPLVSNDNNEKKLTLYQVILSGITFDVLIQIIFLLFLFVELFLRTLVPAGCLKILTSLNVFIMLNIFLVLYETVLNLFYTFWKD